MSAFNGIHTLADGIISQVEICNNENCFGVGDPRLQGFCWECWQQIEMENNMEIFRCALELSARDAERLEA